MSFFDTLLAVNLSDGGGGGGTDSYTDLKNKPQINSVTLTGNKTTADLIPLDNGLEINSDGEMTVSLADGLAFNADGEIENLTEANPESAATTELAKLKVGTDIYSVVTKAVNDLANYYTKSEVYTKSDVYTKTEVNNIAQARFQVVAELPSSDIQTNVIYLVPKSTAQTDNDYDEYIYALKSTNPETYGWEKIGDTEIDLSGYVTTSALNTALADYTTTTDLTTLLAGKQNTLTFDSTPTAQSTNPVTSGGIYNFISDLVQSVCYGFHIDGKESDPDSMISYVADAVGMTPAYMDFTNDKFEFGSWKDAFFMPRPCILGQDGVVQAYLNSNDYSKDIDGNTVTIDSTLTGANVMIEFPKIWYKVVPDAGDDTSGTVYISNKKLDSEFKDYAYIDYQGNHKEHFYMSAYNGVTIDSILRSVSNGQITRLVSADSDIAKASANGNGWYIEDEGERQLINFLLLLIGKSTNTQKVFGEGLSTGGSESQFNSFRTGIHNTKGLFYGTNNSSASSDSNAVKVFGIENWWGLQWRRKAGDILSGTNRLIKMCYGTEDGSTVNSYNTNGNGYVNVGASPSGTSGGYISKMKFTEFGMFEKNASGSETTYFCDNYTFNTGQTNYASCGGRATSGSACGAFAIALDNNNTNTWAGGGYTGSSPSYK